MATSSAVVAEAVEAMLEDQIADIWPDYACLYDVRSPEFKNRDLRDRAIQEMAEKLGKTFNFLACVENNKRTVFSHAAMTPFKALQTARQRDFPSRNFLETTQ